MIENQYVRGLGVTTFILFIISLLLGLLAFFADPRAVHAGDLYAYVFQSNFLFLFTGIFFAVWLLAKAIVTGFQQATGQLQTDALPNSHGTSSGTAQPRLIPVSPKQPRFIGDDHQHYFVSYSVPTPGVKSYPFLVSLDQTSSRLFSPQEYQRYLYYQDQLQKGK